MISIIICSVDPQKLTAITKNIEDTIGVTYEILSNDNRVNKFGLSQVYNHAAESAQYDVLCFMHEDVIIHTKGWGKCLFNGFEAIKSGLIGVSGSVYKSHWPATWSACDPHFYRTNTIQHFKGQASKVELKHNPDGQAFSQVAVLDGVFLATTKSCFAEHQFDEELLKGFHGYDLDFSIQIGLNNPLLVSHEIKLEHFSEGNLDKQWITDVEAVHKKWKKVLPLKVGNIEKALMDKSDFIACSSYLDALIKVGYTKKSLKQYLKLITSFPRMNKMRFTRRIFSQFLLSDK